MSGRWSFLDRLECPNCAWTGDPGERHGLCPSCDRPLLARYDLEGLRAHVHRDELAGRPHTMWRYHELLPVQAPEGIVSLGEVVTPLVRLERLGRELGLDELLLKDEGLAPTGSFKARGAATGVSRALELGVRRIAMPTNGNAGAAWALYGAKAGIETLIAMPRGAPDITRRECAAAGAHLFLVDGLIGDAGRMVADAVAAGDWIDVGTLKEPYRIEGKKTMGLEIVEQLGWELPDVVVYPTGGGVGLIGIHKAMRELRALGWVSGFSPASWPCRPPAALRWSTPGSGARVRAVSGPMPTRSPSASTWPSRWATSSCSTLYTRRTAWRSPCPTGSCSRTSRGARASRGTSCARRGPRR